MDIRHLHYFAEVARQLSFTKAAASLHVSQPSLSKAIKHLEEQFGVPLFYRSSKQLELTDAGKAVLVNAQAVLEAFANLNAELTDVMELKKGEIKIGIPPIIGAAFFSRFISRFKEKYPLVRLLLTEVGSKKIKQGVAEGALDIGLVCNLPIENDTFEVIKLLKDPLMLIVHREHPLAKQARVNVSTLADEAYIIYRQDFSLYDRILEECARHGFYPNIVCESSQKEFMIEMVEAKLGIAFLPSKIAKAITSKQVIALPLQSSNLSLELGMIWKKHKYLPFAVRKFITMSQENMAHLPAM